MNLKSISNLPKYIAVLHFMELCYCFRIVRRKEDIAILSEMNCNDVLNSKFHNNTCACTATQNDGVSIVSSNDEREIQCQQNSNAHNCKNTYFKYYSTQYFISRHMHLFSLMF